MLSDTFLSGYYAKQPDWGFDGLGYVVYKRTYARKVNGRTEEWWETVQRVVEGLQDIGANYTVEEMERLYDYMFRLKGMPAGRGLWQLGTDNPKRLGGDSLVNCWATALRSPEDFEFMFNELMLGGGVGFSVRRSDIGELPMVLSAEPLATHERTNDADYIVPDKREGWGELIHKVFDAFFHTGEPFTYSTLLIRGKGEPIHTFGGTASGPGILIEGIDKIQDILAKRAYRKLRSVDVLDIANIIGSIVVAGNVRRSAQIAIGDPDDLTYLRAKRWDLGNIPSHRAMSNNSVDMGNLDELPEEFWQGYNGGGEPYGMFNLEVAQKFGRTWEVRKDRSIVGVNPCGEVPLAHHEPCNLAEIFLPRINSPEELIDIAKLLYKGQKAIAALPYQNPISNQIVHENMRLGLSVTGIAQSLDKLHWLSPAYEELRAFDREWSIKMGWPESVRLTTVKPSGTLSLLAGVTPGVHPAYSQFHIRRVRMAADDPVVRWCKNLGYRTEWARGFDGKQDKNTIIVEFPCRFPEDTITADKMTAEMQLDLARGMQADWADNAVSVTVYYDKSEIDFIRSYLKEHWHTMKSVSFLPRTDHGFDQAPLEEITEAEYHERRSGLRTISPMDVDTLRYDLTDEECEGGACPIR